ncbi:SH3 and multiple ankyrin repeat domains protein 2 isoform X2 [Culicoides brevitarsis]|uniref:SH3 and multiple ankyrin repeat domains protein 2 isoform X2 n=1 Tax=Culicoides brevitarsis TaxID=469753 RepID=UPI00307C7E16
METQVYDDEPPPEPREGWLLIRIYVPELNVHKCLQFPSDKLVWDVKQQVLASLPKELKESFNYGLFCPPSNGRAGKFLDEERRLGDYPFNGPVGYLELKYKRRVYKMLNLDEKQLKALHTRANLRRFLECVNGGHVEKISKMCTKGLDPNFHCQESGETPLTLATRSKKPNKLLIALVNGGALLDYRTKDGVTALHRAVEFDCLEAVSTLLELGASPNYRDTKGITPVYLSIVKKSDPKICEILLHDHATLGIQDTQGWQEVHQACRNGMVHHLEHLLFYGADMDGQNASGNTPLHVCAVNNQEACARMLLFRGAQRDALNYANQTPYQVAVIAGNLELAEIIQNYKSEDIVPFRGPPRYNPRRRSGLGWGATLSRIGGPPSPCPSEHPFSSASSSLSEGSSHRSHEDDISIVTDKSLGDTSDIISDSSGVGTNSDSAACSIGHPSTTVVCMEAYNPTVSGHLVIQPGDVIEVVGSTDCGLLEGYVRGTNRTGFFPSHVVQEVQFRQKSIVNVSTASMQYSTSMMMPTSKHDDVMDKMDDGMMNKSDIMSQSLNYNTAPRMKKQYSNEPRTVILHKSKRGFGFILRGAKQSSPLMQLKPSMKCPALQYLDDVDPGGVADLAGLKPGDFLLEINGEDVAAASHEHVVDLIRRSGSLVSLTVVTLPNNHTTNTILKDVPNNNNSGCLTPIATRQCSTLPRRMSGPGKLPAPAPPRRDPRTTLSVGRARAKSMVAGLENGGEKDDDDSANHTKCNSIESINHAVMHSSAMSTPTAHGPGTPTQPRVASIKSRPTSSRITAAELEELFSRQHGTDSQNNRFSTMMTSSRFQSSGLDSSATTPPASPNKAPLVYASVADMKRKQKGRTGTLKGRPVAIPTVQSDLKRTFHSTPDLATGLNSSTNSIQWTQTFKNHRSQDDMHNLNMSMSRLNLPPPTCPPPPIPAVVGQVVKVDVKSEYESTVNLQKQIQAKMQQMQQQKTANQQQVKESAGQAKETEIMSSFRPGSNAKIYASPQDLKKIASNQPRTEPPATTNATSTVVNNVAETVAVNKSSSVVSPYAQPGLPGNIPPPPAPPAMNQPASTGKFSSNGPAPMIPEPDYSFSESDGEEDISVRQVKIVPNANNTTTIQVNSSNNNNISPQPQPIETSGNSNASGSSSGSSSMAQSFSVDDIQKMRTKLKSSKSYPNDFLRQQNQNRINENNEEGDNSSSGVSSDQEIQVNNNGTPETKKAPVIMKQEVVAKQVVQVEKTTVKAPPVQQTTPQTQQQNNLKPSLVQKTTQPTSILKQTSTHIISSSNSYKNSNSINNTSQSTPNNMNEQPKKVAAQFNTTPVTTRITNSIVSKMIPQQQAPALPEKTRTPTLQQQQQQQRYQQTLSQIQAHKAGTITPKKLDLQQQLSNEQRSDDDDLSPSPPSMGFQRHNSLTRKQAAQLAAQRAKAMQNQIRAVSLAQLPPPLEADSDDSDSVATMGPATVVLAPPPEFCDFHPASQNNPRVRIVGAVPKANRLHSQ